MSTILKAGLSAFLSWLVSVMFVFGYFASLLLSILAMPILRVSTLVKIAMLVSKLSASLSLFIPIISLLKLFYYIFVYYI